MLYRHVLAPNARKDEGSEIFQDSGTVKTFNKYGMEDLPLRCLPIIRFLAEFEKLSDGLCNYIVEDFIDRNEELNNLKKCFFETSGFGVLKVVNFETARIIYLTCKIVSIDHDNNYGNCTILPKPGELVINSYRVVFEIVNGGTYMITPSNIVPRGGLMLCVLKVGNMNRLVKNAIESYGRPFEPGYIFNRKTGEFAEHPSSGYAGLFNWYRVTNQHYPIYNGQDYVAYCWRDEIILNSDYSIIPKDMTEFIKRNRLVKHELNYRV